MEIETENTIVSAEIVETPITVEAKEQVVTITTEENICTVSITEQKNIIETKEEVIEIVTEETPVTVETYDKITINNITALGDYILIKKAGEAVNGHRAVFVEDNKAYKSSASSINELKKTIGLSTNGAITGDDVIIITYGEVENSGWNWNLNKNIYVGEDGELTQNPASNILQLATAISATKIFIDKKIVIKRSI